MPNAEHRQCARHVYANFLKRWTGLKLKNLFWQAAKSTSIPAFESVLEKVKEISDDAYNDLSGKKPCFWSRAFLKPIFACDAVENGISECWNSMIKEFRAKPIILMLEDIRLSVAGRLINQRKECELWTDVVCPTIRMRLEESKRHSW